MLIFIRTFLPSMISVFDCRFGFQTLLVWRCEKLTLLPNCLPLPVISHLFIIFPLDTRVKYIYKFTFGQEVVRV